MINHIIYLSCHNNHSSREIEVNPKQILGDKQLTQLGRVFYPRSPKIQFFQWLYLKFENLIKISNDIQWTKLLTQERVQKTILNTFKATTNIIGIDLVTTIW